MKLYCIVPNYRKCDVDNLLIKQQTVQPIETLVIEDDSGVDGIHYDGNITTWKRKDRNYTAKNIWDAKEWLQEKHLMHDRDVIAIIDGDDSLFNHMAFDVVAQKYSETMCWLTYGSYILKSWINNENIKVHRGPYRAGDDFRRTVWRGSHLKTFKWGLFKHLQKKHLRDEDGEFLKMGSDLALMFPLMEMAGHDRIAHISNPVYVYNDMNDMNDHRVDGKLQKETEYYIRDGRPEKRLKTMKMRG